MGTASCTIFCADEIQCFQPFRFLLLSLSFVKSLIRRKNVSIHTLPGVIMLQCTALRVEWTGDNLSDWNVSPLQIANKTTGVIFFPSEKTRHDIIIRGEHGVMKINAWRDSSCDL